MSVLTAFALRNLRVVGVFAVLAIIVGVFTFRDMPRFEDPNIVIREAIVTASFPGMSPLQVEDLITRKLEEQIRTLAEVDEIRSISKSGTTIIHVTLGDNVGNLDAAFRDLRNKVSDIAGELPDGTIGPTVNDNFGETAVASIALWSDGFTLQEMRDIARDVRDRLTSLDGVKKVSLLGVQDERVLMKFSNAKLTQFGLTPANIGNTLEQQNILLPGGRFDLGGSSLIIEPSGNFRSLADIRDVLIAVPETGQSVSLIDIVEIERDLIDPPDQPVLFRGKPAIVVSVSVLDGVNSVQFGEDLRQRVSEIEGSLPWGYVLEFATFQPELIERAVSGAVNNVYQTLVTVLIVVMVFLGVRTGLIVGSFVPLTILVGIIIMALIGVDLQRVSIAATIVALGLLVDNGIVVAEDIRARLEQGIERRTACLDAGRTLAIPLLTSSLTTILAFVPMLLIVGGTGEFVISLPLVIIILLLTSWLLSMTVTPAMCFAFMKVRVRASGVDNISGSYEGRFYRIYGAILTGALRQRFVVLAGVVIALVASGYGFQFVAKSFFPAGDRNQFLAYIDLPASTRTTRTRDVIEEYVGWLENDAANPEVTSTVAYVGSGGPRFFLSLSPNDPDPHVAFVLVDTETNAQVAATVERSRQFLLDRFPDVRGRIKPMWLGGTESGLVEIRIIGPDADILFEKAQQLRNEFAAIPGTLDVRHDWTNRTKKLQVLVDQKRARRSGVTSQEVALSLNAFVDGAQITEYREGDKIIPVILQSASEERESVFNLADINVYSTSRASNVPLSQIADFQGVWELDRIVRRDQERAVAVEGKHEFLEAGELLARLEPAIDALELGPDYRWEVGAELENSAEAQERLFGNMPFAALAIVVLLIWQFNSFRRPLIILLTIPLSLIGGIIGLLVLNAPFSFFAILGVFSLAGIIINNGIVLIDRIDTEISNGKEAYSAVIDSCLARFRPILMTTITTILGLMPLIISRDPLFFPLASLVTFGLALGTVLTLGIVPILYTLLFRVPIPKRT